MSNKNHAPETLFPIPIIKPEVTLEPHVCRSCFGRVASMNIARGMKRYLCTNCGLSAEGFSVSVVCSCGIKLHKSRGDGRGSGVMVDAGVRCHENKNRTPEFPSLYVASFAGA